MRKGFPWEIWCSCGSRLVALYYRGRRRCHRCRRHCRRCRRRPTKIFKKKIFKKKICFDIFLTYQPTDGQIDRDLKKRIQKRFLWIFFLLSISLSSRRPRCRCRRCRYRFNSIRSLVDGWIQRRLRKIEA